MENKNTANSEVLKDTTIMAFGSHKGKALVNVPGDYLLWLEKQKWFKEKAMNAKLLQYIEINRDVLEMEAKAVGK